MTTLEALREASLTLPAPRRALPASLDPRRDRLGPFDAGALARWDEGLRALAERPRGRAS